MATIEKLFVQIFDSKRRIIEHLKQQKQVYDQHLVSKLLIQGIPIPPWLILPDFPPSSLFSELSKEDLISGLLLPQPGPLVSYPNGPLYLYDQPATKTVNSELPNELHATTCASSNADGEDVHAIVHQHHVDETEDEPGASALCHVDGTEDIPSYIPMSPEDQNDTMISSTYLKAEQSLARIQRSRSRQKALELRSSAKAVAKSCLGKENDNDVSSNKEICMNGQQLDGLRESVELVKPLVLPDEACTQEAATARCQQERRGSDAGDSFCLPRGDESMNIQTQDTDKNEEKYNDSSGLAESRSCFPQYMVGDHIEYRGSHEVHSGKLTSSTDGALQTLETENFQNRRVNRSSCDRKYFINEDQGIGNDGAYCGRITRSMSGLKEATGGNQNFIKSNEVYVGRMTRSRSGNMQQTVIDEPQKGRVIRPQIEHSLSISGNFANGNINASSNQIRRSRSCGVKIQEAEVGNSGRWTKDDLSVKPKQLVFDEVEENCLPETHTGFQDKSEEKSRFHHFGTQFASLPCTLSAQRSSKGVLSKKLEVRGTELAYSSPRSDIISSGNMLLPDSPSKSQVTKEHELRNTMEFAKDPILLGLNGESYQKHKSEGEGGQSFSEAIDYSLINFDAKAKVNLHDDANEASICLGNIKHESCSGKVHVESLHDQTTECQFSPGRDSVRSLGSNPDFRVASSSHETNFDYASNVSNVDSQLRKEGVQTSCFSSNVGFAHAKVQELQSGINILSECNCNNAMDGSWPCYKRRKIGYQHYIKSASPSVRLNPFLTVDKSIQCNSSEVKEDDSSSRWMKLAVSHDRNSMYSNHQSSVLETDQSARISHSNEPQLTPMVHPEERDVGLEENVIMPFTNPERQLSSNITKAKTTEHSDSLLDKEKATEDALTAPYYSGREHDDMDSAKDLANSCSALKFAVTDMIVDQRQSLQGVGKVKFSVGSPLIERMDVCFYDDGDVPEYESFIIAEKRESMQNALDGSVCDEIPSLITTTECTGLLGSVSKSTSFGTPVSPFPTGYKCHQTLDVYHSVPNGFLENIERSTQLLEGAVLAGKSYSDYFSFPRSRPGWDNEKPYVSPLGKGFDGIASRSGGSDKPVSGNAELICFPIQEDPEICDEEGNVNNEIDTNTEKIDSIVKNSSIREPLCDITADNESTLDPSPVDGGSSESVQAEIIVDEMPNKECKKNEVLRKNRQRRQGKENQNLSICANSVKKQSESLSSRYSKPKLSGKSSFKSRGQSFSEKEPKRNNIVSNVKSFLPLVQQKQAAVAAPAKREVKVKALEAAEAAKRLAEKRENERKQKKEAMKLERARMEQENLKQMELRQKLKEEEKKKRDAENAAKKRHREEEEKKEKERKRKRIEEARVQQQRAEEKLNAWREEAKCETEDGMTREKDSNDKALNQDYGVKAEDMSRKLSDELHGNDRIDAGTAWPAMKASTGSSDAVQVASIDIAEISTPNHGKNDQLINQISQEQSYDISPYQCSDDEEDEEDDVPKKKFVPTWASKSCVALALSSLSQIDPDRIFPPGTFCSLEEVLLPRRLNTKNKVG